MKAGRIAAAWLATLLAAQSQAQSQPQSEPPAEASAPGASYLIDPTHTFAWFEVLHSGTSTIRTRFDRKQGTIRFDREGRSGRAEITLQMASLSSGVAPFDSFLKGAEMFDVATHPTARFVGERFVFAGDRLAEVAGTLTLMGRTLPLSLKALRFDCYTSPLFKREVCGGDFEATLLRSQWGLSYGLPKYAPDQVRLLVQVEAIKQ